MRRPFKDKRPIGPLFGQSSADTIQSRLTSGVREDIGFEEGGSVKVYFHSSTNMDELKNGEIALFVTSPPYNVDYTYGSINDAKPYREYMSLLAKVFSEAYNKLMPEGRLCVNVPTIDKTNADAMGEGNIPVASDLTSMMVDDPSLGNKFSTPEINELKRTTDYSLFDHIIWNKGRFDTEVNLGSLGIGRPFRFEHDITHESILIFQKPGMRNLSTIDQDRLNASRLNKDWWTSGPGYEFDTNAKSNLWNIRPSNKIEVNGEKVPTFPEELPRRLIQGYSFVGDIVVDPFAGVGTTLKVAKDLDRLSVGYELREDLRPEIEKRVGESV
ncbi:MAG: DNA modification methylase [Candidatus Nanosalina sp. J07AB43]|jgi:DNA modification methylase|nr:MAG: DNA modification methylase [Candidatus Nanosalina sp. J07AB43]